jgi:23S rRNA (adenine2503-C2)-methyltransferase
MPVNRSEKTDLGALEDAVRHYHARTGRRITYEYCLFEEVNDSAEDAANLAKVTRWAPSKVNIIVYNPVPGADFRSPSEERLEAFIRELVARDVTVTVRRSRGQDIDAACGQLATIG